MKIEELIKLLKGTEEVVFRINELGESVFSTKEIYECLKPIVEKQIGKKPIMNRCPDEIGIYIGQVDLVFPDHLMKEHGGYYIEKKGCCVDNCIKDEILSLWGHGVVTLGCCCGHGVKEGMINVMEKDKDKMIEMNYEKVEDIPEGCWEFTFKPKSKHRREEE